MYQNLHPQSQTIRYLNAVSKFYIYHIPCIDDLFELLGKSKYLTSIDLCKDYWHVLFKQLCHELADFRTPRTELHGAPATFQRLVDIVLLGSSDFAFVYLDDIAIHGHSWKEHLKHL